MDALPWIVVHGALLWRLALAGLAGGGALAGLLAAVTTARRRARRAIAALGEPRGALGKANDGARATLRGRLEVEGVPCERFEDGADAAAAGVSYLLGGGSFGDVWAPGLNVQAERLALRVGEERVEIQGPLEVVVGARETRAGVRFGALPLLVQERVEHALAGNRPHFSDRIVLFRSLAAGDDVVVSGVLRREANDGEASYRSAPVRWAMVPGAPGDADGDPHGIRIASAGAPRVAKVSVRAELWGLAIGLASGLAVFVMVFVGGGAYAARSAAADIASLRHERTWVDDATPEVPASLDPRRHLAAPLDAGFDATQLAAAAPFERERAIAGYTDALARRRDPDARMAARLAALQALRGDCAGAAMTLASRGLSVEGAAVAERCGDRWTAAKIDYAAGEFQRASDVLSPVDAGDDLALARVGAIAHLLGGHPERASKLLRGVATRIESDSPPWGDPLGKIKSQASPNAAAADLALCLAEAIDARSGSEDARARLRTMASDVLHFSRECETLFEDVTPFAERRDLAHRGSFGCRRVDPYPDEHPGPGTFGSYDAANGGLPWWQWALVVEADPSLRLRRWDVPRTLSTAYVLTDPGAVLGSLLPAVEQAALDALVDDPAPSEDRRQTRYRLLLLRARFEAATGETEAARKLLAMARADLAMVRSDLDHFDMVDRPGDKAALDALAATIAIDARDLDTARALLDGGADDPGGALRALLRYAAGGNTDGFGKTLSFWNRGRAPHEEALWTLAASGDGLTLVTWLRRDDAQPGPWLRLGAAHVRAGREELSAWLRHGYREADWRADPRALLASAVLLRRAAEGIGDAEAAAEQRAIAARFREALLRRDVAVPLAILGRM